MRSTKPEQVVVLAEDRERIARDLHDTVIQRLFGKGLGLQSVLAVTDGPLRARLEETIDDVDATIRELRSAIAGHLVATLREALSNVANRGVDHLAKRPLGLR